jgi:PAS domain S-box-containing protein
MAEKIRVLYVDDEPDLLEIGKLFLEQSGDFTVTTALSAPDAVRLLEQEQFDTIISDYMMPGMDGIQFLVEVRTRFGQVPFILFTGKGREEVVIQAINSGADFYLQKGGDPSAQFAELVHKIRQAALRKRAEEDIVKKNEELNAAYEQLAANEEKLRLNYGELATSQSLLQESESFNRGLVENLPDYIVVYGTDGKVLYVNPAVVRAFGYTMEELAGTPILPYVAPECRNVVTASIADRLKGHDPPEYETVLIAKDGQRKTVIAKGTLVHYHDLPATLLLLTDMTGRKVAEEALRVSEEKFRKAFFTSPDSICITRLSDGMFVSINKGFTEITGYTEEDVAGKTSLEINIWKDPEDRRKIVEGLKANGEVRNYEARFLTKTGEIYGSMSTSIIELNGVLHILNITHDITKRKLADDALRVNEKRLQMAQEIGHIGCWEYDITTNQMWGSEEGCHLFGYPRMAGSFPIEDFASCIVERELALKAFNDLINEGKKYDLEFIVNPKDGSSQRTLHSIGRLEKDEQGNPVKVKGITQDITERKHAQEALRESRDRFEAILASLDEAVFLVDPVTRLISECNDATARIFGYSHEELAGKDSSFLHVDQAHFEQFGRDAMVAYDDPGYYATVFEMRRKDGGVFPTEHFVRPIRDSDGRIQYVVSVVRDITERKRAEEALKTSQIQLAEAMDLAYMVNWEFDIATGLFTFDDRFYALYGTTAELEGGNQMPADVYAKKFVHPDDQYVVADEVNKAIQATDPGYVSQVEHRIIRRDGEIRHIVVRFGITKDENGRTIKTHGANQDITGRKRAEEALGTSERRYKNISETTTDFVFSCIRPDGDTYSIDWMAGAVERITGYTIDELVALGCWRCLVIPEDALVFDENVTHLPAGTSRTFILRIQTKNGDTRWLEVNTSNNASHHNRIFGGCRDITGRKVAEEALQENEKRFRTIINSMQFGITIIDAQTHTILEANPKALEMIGGTSESVFGSVCHRYICPAELGKCPVMDLGQTVDSSERVLLNLRGEKIPILKSVIKTMLGGKEVLIESFISITDRKLAEDTLQRVNQKLNVLSQLTRKDLTSQLFVLISYLELAKNRLAGQGSIIEILRGVDDAVRLINETIAYSTDYQEMGAKPPKWQNVKMALLLGLSHTSIGEIQHSLETENLEIFADPLLEMVCQRLCENPVKHGGHVTRIRVSHTVTPNGATIVFEDDGTGIPQEMKEQIFLRSEGTGRASMRSLIFVREILDITGITIIENGEPGKGARFEIAVPNGAWRMNPGANDVHGSKP